MKRPLRYIPTAIGLLSLVYLFSTGDNYSETAYPLLQLNLYLTALIIILPWWEDERFGFEVKVFAPLWLSIAAVIAGMEFLGGLAAILWLAWLFLPLLKIDSVLIFLRELTEDLRLREPTKNLNNSAGTTPGNCGMVPYNFRNTSSCSNCDIRYLHHLYRVQEV